MVERFCLAHQPLGHLVTMHNAPVGSLEDFVAGAVETKGSWWPDWIVWLRTQDAATVPAAGARHPGHGALAAISDAPGAYVRAK